MLRPNNWLLFKTRTGFGKSEDVYSTHSIGAWVFELEENCQAIIIPQFLLEFVASVVWS